MWWEAQMSGTEKILVTATRFADQSSEIAAVELKSPSTL
jgi:hypothetical protein